MTRARRKWPIKRPNRRDDKITIAGLTGAAVFLAGERGDRAAAVAELAARATQPDPDTGRSRVRAELLEEAAGYNLATWQHDAHGRWLGRDAALLLVDAGANAERVKVIAAERLPDFQITDPPGIGNPTQAPGRGPRPELIKRLTETATGGRASGPRLESEGKFSRETTP